jgi:hypothetical protein
MSRTAASAAATADGGGSGLARVTGAVGTSDEPSASSPAEVDAVERGEYPRKSRLSVLAGREDEIRVYNAEHCRWCVRQLTEVDANLAATRGRTPTLQATTTLGGGQLRSATSFILWASLFSEPMSTCSAALALGGGGIVRRIASPQAPGVRLPGGGRQGGRPRAAGCSAKHIKRDS